MDHTPFTISSIIGFKIDFSNSESSPELLSVASTNKIIAIRTDMNLPIISEWPYNDIREILDIKKLPETPTSMDISPDSNLLALGYATGTINIIDLEKKIILKL